MLKIEGTKDQTFSYEVDPKIRVFRPRKSRTKTGKWSFIPEITKRSYAKKFSQISQKEVFSSHHFPAY
jgi:hypothetical protein